MNNKKGINNIVIVVLIVLIVFAGVSMLWMYAGNTLHREGKTIENAASFNGKNEVVVTNSSNLTQGQGEECRIEEVYWYNNGSKVNSVIEGDEVSLAVRGTNCDGKTVNFKIWESDVCIFGLCSDYFIDNFTAVFDEDTLVTTGWKANWMYDSLIGGDPEYYFTAQMDNMQAKSDNLIVEKIESANSPPSGDCRTLAYKGENKIDIVIFSDLQTATTYKEALLSFEPMKTYSEAFNFYYIDDYPLTDACEIYKGIALLCRSKGLIKKASSCPNDYVMVVQSHPTEIRSSAFLNIMSINSNLPMSVVQHEFGHVFASLAEEYVPAIIPKNSQNCAKDDNSNLELDCDRQFGANRNGCYVECSDKNYRRSIDAGVMRTLSSNSYGIFNDNLITERLRTSADLSNRPAENQLNNLNVGFSPTTCETQEYYLVKAEVDHAKAEINLIDVDTYTGCASEESNGFGATTLEIFDGESEEKIAESSFNAELIFVDGNDKIVNGESVINGETFANQEPVYLKVPKEENVKLRTTQSGKMKSYDLKNGDLTETIV